MKELTDKEAKECQGHLIEILVEAKVPLPDSPYYRGRMGDDFFDSLNEHGK